MKRREQARTIALQALYQLDVRGEEFKDDLVEFLRESTKEPEVYFFARRLAEGTWQARAETDSLISRAADNWRIDRMAILDRSILRMATFELLHAPDVPPRVVMDQAIELAKRFGAAESGAFVNGVLDRILRIIEADRLARGDAAPSDAPSPDTPAAPAS